MFGDGPLSSSSLQPMPRHAMHATLTQVHSERCSWEHLLRHLLGEHAADADSAAAALEEGRAAQEAALQQARRALGVDQVISVCSEADQERVIDAARRLSEHAGAITMALDVAGMAPDLYDLIW